MVGRSTSKNKPSRTRPLGSLLLETVRLRAEFTRRSGCAAPSLSWPPAVLAAPHCIKTGISAAHRPLPLFDCLSLSVSPSLPLPRRPGRGTPTPAAAPVHSRFENSSRSSDGAVLVGCGRQRRYSLGKAPVSFPSCPALRRLLYGSRIPFEIHADLSV